MGPAATTNKTKTIFISYRRDDTAGYAGRLHDDLVEWFGPQYVFRDVTRITPGRDFHEVIAGVLESCAAVLVVIGREWLLSIDEEGRRRLDDPEDVLRAEVTAALERGTLVIPVLVEKARMPAELELPEPLRGLARRQAVELSDANWERDVALLAATIAAETAVGGRRRRTAERHRVTRTRRLVRAAAAAVLIGGLLAGLLQWRGRGGPARMTGWFNLAVATFGELDGDSVVSSAAASQLSSRFDRLLAGELREVQGGREVQHRAIGRLAGATPDERASAAEKTAKAIGADVVVYGLLQTDASGSELTPEFYVSDRKLFDAFELVGQHQLGTPLRAPGGAERVSVQNALLDQLTWRSRVLAEATVALGYYSVEDYDQAYQHLQAANREPGWGPNDGREVLYLLLGNLAGKLGQLPEAEEYYLQALDLKPEYSRANLGQAEVIFHRARGQCEAGTVDADGLARSLEAYRRARAGRLVAGADVPAKAAYGEGRVMLCSSQALLADAWNDAESRFIEAIQAYGGDTERLRDLAAEAHATLGYLYRLALSAEAAQKYSRAASEYEAAIALYQEAGRRPDRQAFFQSQLGFLFSRLGDRSRADAAYAAAVRLAPDPQTARQYREAQRQESTAAG
ncbi:MAG: TIR domain-containing protein [Acidimicrobiales bacterium]